MAHTTVLVPGITVVVGHCCIPYATEPSGHVCVILLHTPLSRYCSELQIGSDVTTDGVVTTEYVGTYDGVLFPQFVE